MTAYAAARVRADHGDFASRVAANIRAECAYRGITQTDLAAELGIAASAISARWWGRRQWQLDDIEKVAALFGMPPSELCAIRDSNPEPADLEPGDPIAQVLPFRRLGDPDTLDQPLETMAACRDGERQSTDGVTSSALRGVLLPLLGSADTTSSD